MDITVKRKWELIGAAMSLLLFALCILQPSIRGNDGFGHYAYICSILRKGDLDFRDDYQLFDERLNYPYKFTDLPTFPATGRPINAYGIGSALFWAPFVVPVHFFLKWMDPSAADCMSYAYEWAVGLATAVWGSFALWLLYRRMRQDWPAWASLLGLLGTIFATPLGFYLYAHGSMSHGVSFFVSTCAMLIFERTWHAPKPLNFVKGGVCMALLVMVRFQSMSWALVLGTVLVGRIFTYKHEKGPKEAPTNASRYHPVINLLMMFGGSFVAFLPQLFVWHLIYGSMWAGPVPYLDGTSGVFSLFPHHLIDVLISERGGVIAWHPFFALGIVGLMIMVRKNHHRTLAWIGIIGFISQLYMVSIWSCWWAGASFGNRFFISSLPYISLGTAALFSMAARPVRRSLIIAVFALLIVWNMGLLVQYATLMIPRSDAVPWSQVVKQNLVDVPRLVWKEVKKMN